MMFHLSAFLKGLDTIYASGEIRDVEHYLKQGMENASASGDDGAVFTILNEMMGYYRSVSRYEECENCIREAFKLVDALGIAGTADYGTLLINAATGYRAAGKYQESERLYKEAQEVFAGCLPGSDYRMASLHNNLSLLYGETGRLREAKDELLAAMDIIKGVNDARAEIAITHVNLGSICFQLKQIQEGTGHMKEAIRIFEDLPGQKDSHYASALAGLGEAYYHAGNLDGSVNFYQKALHEIETTYGQNDYYRITLRNLERVTDLRNRKNIFREQKRKGLDISRAYYETYGRPLLRDKYPEYADRIAAGLVGEGSECLGFDDFYSTDHDYGPGFCLWLLKEDYGAIGASLQEDYRKLPREFMGFPARNITGHGQDRVGVFEIEDFYQRLTGYREAPRTEKQWLGIPQEALQTATNGEVFEDKAGVFTAVRNGFLACPGKVRLRRLALSLGKAAQAGQYNYGRARLRGDRGAMYFALSEFVNGASETAYLLNRIYMPFYKWRARAMERFTCLTEIKPALEEIMGLAVTDESMEERIESICLLIIRELNRQGISRSSEGFLEAQKEEVLKAMTAQEKEDASGEQDAGKKARIAEIVKREWDQFQNVRNEGGRALCQDDYGTFEIMRNSQFLVWEQEVLDSYLDDLKQADENHWNMIMEKYARMMESTTPEQFAGFADILPKRSAARIQLQEEIISLEMEWTGQFMERYPKIGAKGRKPHTSQDTPWDTSIETYLRGELGTYSDRTLKLYHKMVCHLKEQGKNMKEMSLEHMVRYYGYGSLAEAENA